MSNVLIKIGSLNAYEHVPNVLDPSTPPPIGYAGVTDGKKKLPVLIMLPGKGEIGTDAKKLLVYGPSKFIQSGWNPQDMIIISVQPLAEWANPAYIDAIMNNVNARYKNISDGRIFMTGLSAGAYAINNYIGKDQFYSKKVSAVVTMSAVEPESYFNPAFFTQPAWGFCGISDSWYDKMKKLYSAKKFTSYIGGHGGWNKFYDPAYKENGHNIYEFLLSTTETDTGTPPVEPQDPEEPEVKAPYPVSLLMSDGSTRLISKE